MIIAERLKLKGFQWNDVKLGVATTSNYAFKEIDGVFSREIKGVFVAKVAPNQIRKGNY